MSDGFIEKTKGFFGFGAVESYDDADYARDDFDEYTGREERPVGRYGAAPGRHPGEPVRDDHDRYAPAESATRTPVTPFGESRRGSYLAGGTVPPVAARDPELVVVQVSSYRDAGKVTPEIRRGDIVAFHLGALDKSEGHQFLAFIMGVAAALDARVEKLDGLRNFALLPSGVRLTMDVRDTLSARLGGDR